jgi:hypothetical protein
MKQLLAIVLVVVVLAFVVWLVMRHNKENFGHGGGFHGGGFHGGHSRGFGRGGRFRGYGGYSGYDWINYYPYWNSYDDSVRSCIANSVMGCGNSKLCYDNAINMCT